MNPNHESKLESLLDRELKKMPGWKAPASLAPRVMAAIAAQARLVWWQRPLWSWPLAAQAAFLAFHLAAIGFLVQLGWKWGALSEKNLLTAFARQLSVAANGLWETLLALGDAAALILRSGPQPWIWGTLAFCLVMYLLCIGAGTAFLRVAWKRI